MVINMGKKKVTVFQLIDLMETSIVGIPAYRDAIRRDAVNLIKSLKSKYGGENIMASKEDIKHVEEVLSKAEETEEKPEEEKKEETQEVPAEEKTETEEKSEMAEMRKEMKTMREVIEKTKDAKDLKEMHTMIEKFIEEKKVSAKQDNTDRDMGVDISDVKVPRFEPDKEAEFFQKLGEASYAADPSFWSVPKGFKGGNR